MSIRELRGNRVELKRRKSAPYSPSTFFSTFLRVRNSRNASKVNKYSKVT